MKRTGVTTSLVILIAALCARSVLQSAPPTARTPVLVELFTSDYLTVDPDHEPIRWTLDDPQRQTLWGHPAPKSWFEEGSPFRGVPVREPVLEARPMVAR